MLLFFLFFIKALLIFLLIKLHYATHGSNLMRHQWTNKGKKKKEERERERKRERRTAEEEGEPKREHFQRFRLDGWWYWSFRWQCWAACHSLAERQHAVDLEMQRDEKKGVKAVAVVGVRSEVLLPNDAEAAPGRWIMAVRDLSDKNYPERRAELPGWLCATPVDAYLWVTASGDGFNVFPWER